MKEIRLHVTFSRHVVLCVAAAAIMLAAVPELDSESVTMTTYYPAPSGVYTNLVTTGNTYLARDGAAASRVGVGTATPASKLSVAGGIQMGDDPARCTPAKDGTVRYRAGSIQYCNATLTTPSWVAVSSSSPAGVVMGSANSGSTVVHNRGQFVVVALTSWHWNYCGGSGACIPPGARVCAQDLNSFQICHPSGWSGPAQAVNYWYYYW